MRDTTTFYHFHIRTYQQTNFPFVIFVPVFLFCSLSDLQTNKQVPRLVIAFHSSTNILHYNRMRLWCNGYRR